MSATAMVLFVPFAVLANCARREHWRAMSGAVSPTRSRTATARFQHEDGTASATPGWSAGRTAAALSVRCPCRRARLRQRPHPHGRGLLCACVSVWQTFYRTALVAAFVAFKVSFPAVGSRLPRELLMMPHPRAGASHRTDCLHRPAHSNQRPALLPLAALYVAAAAGAAVQREDAGSALP